MKKLVSLFFLVFTSILLVGQTFPEKSNHLVTDYTRTLNEREISALEQKLVTFSDSTSTQIAIVVISSLNGYDIADYGVKLAQKWGIGGKKDNNGILLLVSVGDRKVTIQVGYGLEGVLPDAIARRIIENEIKPNFKKGQYYQGLNQGTDAIISYTKGEYKSVKPQKSNGNRTLFFIILILIIIVIISRIKRGGGGQVIGSNGGTSPFWWFLLGSGLGSGRGNSGWGGGSSDGGGFGGFGGGSFGGGGASGDW